MKSEIEWFIPGPSPIDGDVFEAMSSQPIDHRSADMHRLLDEIQSDLRGLFKTKNPVFISTSSASAVMEAVLRNLVSTRVLCLVNGSYGLRWQQMARANGIPVEALHFEPGKPVDPSVVADELKKRYYDLVTVVHTETSTGVQNPLEAIATVVRLEGRTLLAVDAVASLLTTPLDVDALSLDVCISVSYNGLALPPGLTLFSVSEHALERASRMERRGYYLDLLRFRDYHRIAETPNTPAVNLLYALSARLKRLRSGGDNAEIRRCQEMAEFCRRWAVEKFALFPEERYAASALTVVRNTLSLSVAELNQFLRKKAFQIADGCGELKNTTFRIGHSGAHREERLKSLLEAIDEFIKRS